MWLWTINSDAQLLTTDEAARFLGVSRSFIYKNSEALGAFRIGSGPKAPIRFSSTDLRHYLYRQRETVAS
jgi:excisionase family DNA binding protein